MRAYNNIRFQQYPDISDIQCDGRASHVGRLWRDRNGVLQGDSEHGYIRNPHSKAATRRYLKRLDRRMQRQFEMESEGE